MAFGSESDMVVNGTVAKLVFTPFITQAITKKLFVDFTEAGKQVLYAV